MLQQQRSSKLVVVGIILVLLALVYYLEVHKRFKYLLSESKSESDVQSNLEPWSSQLLKIDEIVRKNPCAPMQSSTHGGQNNRCGYNDLFTIKLGIYINSASQKLKMSEDHLFLARLYIQTVKFSVTNLFNVNYAGLIDGSSWPPEFKMVSSSESTIEKCQAPTMVGMRRIDNVQFVLEDIIQRGIKGDFIETGVWKGGVGIFARAVLTAYKQFNRRVLLADSFQGIPPSNVDLFPVDRHHVGANTQQILSLNYTGGEKAVRNRVNTYFHLFSGPRSFSRNSFAGVQFVENAEDYKNQPNVETIYLAGYFKDSLPKAVKEGVIKCLAVLRLDGDLYESTWQGLEYLYPYLNQDGVIIVDDFTDWVGSFQAVHDFRRKMKIDTPIIQVNHGPGEFVRGVYFLNPHKSQFC